MINITKNTQNIHISKLYSKKIIVIILYVLPIACQRSHPLPVWNCAVNPVVVVAEIRLDETKVEPENAIPSPYTLVGNALLNAGLIVATAV